ncbi:uncharacterized protein LOC124896271 [Capsicum annuum]|uniref:uncharacterized protein LOC124896271 n=1 Tax=Capsicum annuum TaxID=4072 RepID=UPI001FB082C6|nr:uncharacterized protein LOC124896271 [Capsicum annuum]
MEGGGERRRGSAPVTGGRGRWSGRVGAEGPCLRGRGWEWGLFREGKARAGVGSRSGVRAGSVRGGRRRRVAREARLRETKWVRSKERDVDWYKPWYSGSERRWNGVGILVDESLEGSVYASQVGLEEKVKARFWETLDEVVRSVPSSKKIVIAGDFNGHIRVLAGGYADCMKNEKVKKKVKIKKRAYVKLIESKDEEEKRVNREVFKVARKEANLAVTTVKTATFESLLAKVRERKDSDLDQVKCIKGEDDRALVEDVRIKKRWQKYFHKLLNEEGDRSIELGELKRSEESCDFSYCRRFKVEEVREAIR